MNVEEQTYVKARRVLRDHFPGTPEVRLDQCAKEITLEVLAVWLEMRAHQERG